mgnify:CR=1 FL=1
MRILFNFILFSNNKNNIMFDDLRGGINTRLYSKNKYDTKKNSFLKNRSKEDQNIMKIDLIL